MTWSKWVTGKKIPQRAIQIIKHIRLQWEEELLADTNLATLTMITDFHKSNKHATRDLRAVVQDTFLIFTFHELQKLFLHYKKKKKDIDLLGVQSLLPTKCNTSSE